MSILSAACLGIYLHELDWVWVCVCLEPVWRSLLHDDTDEITEFACRYKHAAQYWLSRLHFHLRGYVLWKPCDLSAVRHLAGRLRPVRPDGFSVLYNSMAIGPRLRLEALITRP